METLEQVIVDIFGYDGVQRGKYFRGDTIRGIKVEA